MWDKMYESGRFEKSKNLNLYNLVVRDALCSLQEIP